MVVLILPALEKWPTYEVDYVRVYEWLVKSLWDGTGCENRGVPGYKDEFTAANPNGAFSDWCSAYSCSLVLALQHPLLFLPMF